MAGWERAGQSEPADPGTSHRPSIHLPSIFHPSSIDRPSIVHRSSVDRPSIIRPSSVHLLTAVWSLHIFVLPQRRRCGTVCFHRTKNQRDPPSMHRRGISLLRKAERAGFEPANPFRLHAFQACALSQTTRPLRTGCSSVRAAVSPARARGIIPSLQSCG